MKKALSFIAASIAALVVACTPAEQKTAATAIDVTGKTCEVIFVALDPALTPLCTTAEDIAVAVLNIVSTKPNDAGTDAAPGAAPNMPSNAEVYAYLKAHGAQPIKQ